MDQDPKPEFAKFEYMLPGPGRLISPGEYELLVITAEDLSHLIQLVDDNWFEFAPEIRPYSTMLRRLFGGAGDIYRATKVMRWRKRFRVSAKMLDYPRPHGQVIAAAGGWRWGTDTLPDMSSVFGGKDVPPPPKEWSHRRGVDLSLKQYLSSLSFAITGTRVSREDVITFVANKKAAHTDDNRESRAHQALDNVWDGLFLTRRGDDGSEETLNAVYLELLTIIHTIAESAEIREFVQFLQQSLAQAARVYDGKTSKVQSITVPMPKESD